MARTTEERIHKLSVRLTEQEYQEIKTNAEIVSMGRSTYVRNRVLGHRIKSRLNLTMIAELRRIGGLLKLVHMESKGAYSEKTMEMLNELQFYVKKLSAEKE